MRAKTPSTPHDQSVGVKNGIDKVRKLLEAEDNWSGKFDAIHHGTTVGRLLSFFLCSPPKKETAYLTWSFPSTIAATNAILEGKGVRAGLVVTAGYKDVLVNRRSQIPGGLGGWINFVPPAPLIPLERTVELPGARMAADGSEVAALDAAAEASFRAALADLVRQQPEAVVISLLNSYQNNAHEKQAAAIVKDVFKDSPVAVEIVCSADVLPELGEYERTVTAAANAVVKPLIRKYLDGLQRLLAEDSDTIRILKSDGGLSSLDLASELPVNLLM